MDEPFSERARAALKATDWPRVDAMTDADIARQIGGNPDAAPDMAPQVDVRALRERLGMSLDAFAAAYGLERPLVYAWERGSEIPGGPALTLLRAIAANPDALRRAIAAV